MRLKDALLLKPPSLGLFIARLMLLPFLLIVSVIIMMLFTGRVSVEKSATLIEHETR